MMKKTIKTGKVKAKALNKKAMPRKVDPATFDFPEGCRFVLGSKFYTVKKAESQGDNTEWRYVNCDGDDQFIMLSTLRNDAIGDDNFVIVN